MKTNFDLVKDRSVVMDGIDMIAPYKIFPTVKDFVDFLNLPVEEKILDDVEKRYIKNIVRPFREQVSSIKKFATAVDFENLAIRYKEGETIYVLYFPRFKKGTMYEGMELDREYTLKELGITFKN